MCGGPDCESLKKRSEFEIESGFKIIAYLNLVGNWGLIYFSVIRVLIAFICKNTGLELNPALRDGSISHPFPLLCGFQEMKLRTWRKAASEEISGSC